jgi:stage II sporulation protein D
LGLTLSACAPRSELAGGMVQLQLGQAPTQLPPALQRTTGFNGPPLRVLLRRSAQGLKVSASGGLRLRDPDSRRVLAELPAQGRGRLSATGNGLGYNGRALGLSFALVEPLRDGEPLKVAGRRYRGLIGLQASGGQLLVLNVVGLEDYLKGVLPSEVPADWPLEAQKAQAVAARSFALAQQAKAKPLWDVDDSVSSQVYKGLDAERPRPVQAVDGTRGLVLSHAGSVIEAFFHSNSGGHTADVAEVWGAKIPYLQGVLDVHSEGQKHYAWTAVIPRDQAENALIRAGLWRGYLDGIAGRGLSESGRWLNVELMGRDERRIVKATALRSALGVDRLRSTRFNVRLRGDDLVFEGLGWGHGVGLSQEGAHVLAQRGWTYARILQHYYPGTRLAQTKP